MISVSTLIRMFRYDRWANHECIAQLQRQKENSQGLRYLVHILAAQKLWLERLQGVPQSMAVWPDASVEQCQRLADEMAVAWVTYLNPLSVADLDRKIEYRNSKGEPWQSRVEDVLLHVILHSAYHRGQVALTCRLGGSVPAYTDFIHAVRNNFIGDPA